MTARPSLCKRLRMADPTQHWGGRERVGAQVLGVRLSEPGGSAKPEDKPPYPREIPGNLGVLRGEFRRSRCKGFESSAQALKTLGVETGLQESGVSSVPQGVIPGLVGSCWLLRV